MLTIRFNRVGKSNKSQFRIVVQEHTVAPGGRHVEVLGSHDPHSKQTVLKEDRIKYWIEKGAQLSDTVHNLLITKEVIKGEKRKRKMKKKAEEVKEEGGAEAPKAETEQKVEEKPKEENKTENPVVETEQKVEEKKEEPAKEEKKEEKKEEGDKEEK